MPTIVSVDSRTDRELWTSDEFIESLHPGVHADLIDGERFVHSPVSLRHADLLNFVHLLLGWYVDGGQLGKLYREVVAVRLSARNVFLPDLAFFTPQQAARLGPTYAAEAPSLVVEALSPWSAERDVGPKFANYEQAGVREYWILDPETLAHRFYRREGELLVEFAAGDAVIRSVVVPGFWMRREWLDPDRLPKVTEALAQLTGQR